MNQRNESIAASFIAGAVVGALTALALAPKSGRELREDIKDNVKTTADDVVSKVQDEVEVVKGKTRDTMASIRNSEEKAAETLRDKARAAVKEAQEKLAQIDQMIGK